MALLRRSRLLGPVLAIGVLLGGGAGAAASPPSLARARQVVVVSTDGWSATTGWLRLYQRRRRGLRAEGPAIPVVVGRAGMAWARGQAPQGAAPDEPFKVEGDGKSPAGIFPLGEVTGYAARAPAGVRLHYRQATDRLRCVDDPASPAYNRVLLAPAGRAPPWASDERMRRDDGQYQLVLVVDHNPARRAGDGSCVFLHVAAGPDEPTSGCTAMLHEDLLRLLRALRPWPRPLLLQGPRSALHALERAGRIPPLGG